MNKKRFFDKSDFLFICLNIGIAIVVIVLLLICLIAYLRRYTEHGTEVEVPNIRGMVVTEAEPVLAQQELRLTVIDSTYSDKVPFGTIVEQDPKPDSHVTDARSM